MTTFKRLLTGIVFLGLSARPALAAKPGFYFSPSEVTVSENGLFSVDVVMDTGGFDSGGGGARITFDPAKLRADKILPAEIFADYPALIIDNTNGKIVISGISASINDLYNGRAVFATINFYAKTAGKTTADFVFEPNSTTDSNIAVTFGNGDVLTEVNSLKITVNESGGDSGAIEEPTAEAEPAGGGWAAAINDFLESIDLPALLPETETSRPGRASTTNISADGPLTRQPAITDPITTQPETNTQILNTKPGKEINPVLLIAGGGVGLIILVFLVLKKLIF